MRQMPGTAVRVDRRIAGVRQRPVGDSSILRRSRLVDHRPHDRMAETNCPVEFGKLRARRRIGCLGRNVEALRGAPQQAGVADGLGSSDQQQPPRLRPATPRVALKRLPPPVAARSPRPAGRTRRRAGAATGRERTRAARTGCRGPPGRSGRAHDYPSGVGITTPKQGSGIGGAQRPGNEFRDPFQVDRARVGVTQREHERDGLASDTPGDERERLRRGPIEPLHVVDKTDQRSGIGLIGKKPEHRQADHQPIRRRAGVETERGL